MKRQNLNCTDFSWCKWDLKHWRSEQQCSTFKASVTQRVSKALGREYHLHFSWRLQSWKVEKSNDTIMRHLHKLTQETQDNRFKVLSIALMRAWTAPEKEGEFSSVTQSCPTLCDPMNHSTPGLPVHHQLPSSLELMSIESVMPSSHLILCRPLLLLPPIPPSIRVFSNGQLFSWGGQSTGVSALASFLPKNTQGWPPLERPGWISLQSKGLSRVFSNTTVQKHQFFGAQLSL